MPRFFKKASAVEGLNVAAPHKTRSTLLKSYCVTSEPLLRVTSIGGTICIMVTCGKLLVRCMYYGFVRPSIIASMQSNFENDKILCQSYEGAEVYSIIIADITIYRPCTSVLLEDMCVVRILAEQLLWLHSTCRSALIP